MKKFAKIVLMANFIRSLIIILSFLVIIIMLFSSSSKAFMPKLNMKNSKIVAMIGKPSFEVINTNVNKINKIIIQIKLLPGYFMAFITMIDIKIRILFNIK